MFVGVPNQAKLLFQNILGVPEGSLRVKYLGVPLTTTRLEAQDCCIFLEKILNRV